MQITDLFEGLSSIIYHGTSVYALNKILDTDTLHAVPDLGTHAEKFLNKSKHKIYYISTTRTRTGAYHRLDDYSREHALIVLDGRKLMADGYTGNPVDYWGYDFSKRLGKSESEDRIYLDKPEIPNIHKYIKEIHIFVKPLDNDKLDDNRENKRIRIARLAYIKARKKGLPVFLYTDYKSFNILDKRNTVSINDLQAAPLKRPLPDTDVKPGIGNYISRSKPFAIWMELLLVDDKEKLSPKARKALWYPLSAASLKADIHNYRTNNKRPQLLRFLQELQKKNIHSVEEYIDYVENKFNQ